MDYEQKYYDLLYEKRNLESKIDILENELLLIKNNKNYKIITFTFINKINELSKIINKAIIYNSKIVDKADSNINGFSLENLKILEAKDGK